MMWKIIAVVVCCVAAAQSTRKELSPAHSRPPEVKAVGTYQPACSSKRDFGISEFKAICVVIDTRTGEVVRTFEPK